MKALRVTYRGKQRTIALEHQGVLTVFLTCAEGCKPDPAETNELSLGGLDTQTNSYLDWDKVDLELGDEVVIEVIENCAGDPPEAIRPIDKIILEGRKNSLRQEAKELGWTIVESPSVDSTGH